MDEDTEELQQLSMVKLYYILFISINQSNNFTYEIKQKLVPVITAAMFLTGHRELQIIAQEFPFPTKALFNQQNMHRSIVS